MKKTILLIGLLTLSIAQSLRAQTDAYLQQMEKLVAQTDTTQTIDGYQKLAQSFLLIAEGEQKQWLPYYYAAYCNARIGWIYQTEDRTRIAPFADRAQQQTLKAKSLIDTTQQLNELSEIYCLLSIVNRERMYEKPMTVSGKECGTAIIYTIERAKELNKENPRATYLDGWLKYYSPISMGGDKDKARKLLKKASGQFKKEQPPHLYPSWGESDCIELLNL